MLCHAMVSDKPGGLSVCSHPLPQGKLAAQLKSPSGDSCFLCSVDSWRRRRRRRCYRNCTPGGWSSWTTCTRGSGTGTQYRTRGIFVPALCGGTCSVALKETRYCNTHCCRVNCAWNWHGMLGAGVGGVECPNKRARCVSLGIQVVEEQHVRANEVRREVVTQGCK